MTLVLIGKGLVLVELRYLLISDKNVPVVPWIRHGRLILALCFLLVAASRISASGRWQNLFLLPKKPNLLVGVRLEVM